VIVYEKVYSKIIARDLSVMVSRLYRMAITLPWTCRVPLAVTITAYNYVIRRFNSRPPGLEPPVRGKERQQSNKHSAYVLLRCNKSCYRSVPHRATVWRIQHPGKLHFSSQVVKTQANAICTWPRSNEVKKRREKQETSKIDPVLNISTC
jgi:hypothetical protein